MHTATAYYTGLYMEMLRNSLDLTVCYRAEGHGSRDGWHTYLRSVEIFRCTYHKVCVAGQHGPRAPIGRLAESGRTQAAPTCRPVPRA